MSRWAGVAFLCCSSSVLNFILWGGGLVPSALFLELNAAHWFFFNAHFLVGFLKHWHYFGCIICFLIDLNQINRLKPTLITAGINILAERCFYKPWMIHSLLFALLISVFGCCSSLWPLVIQLNWVMCQWCQMAFPGTRDEPDRSLCRVCPHRPSWPSLKHAFSSDTSSISTCQLSKMSLFFYYYCLPPPGIGIHKTL